MDRYESRVDAVYKRRGWTPDDIPRPERLAKIGMADALASCCRSGGHSR